MDIFITALYEAYPMKLTRDLSITSRIDGSQGLLQLLEDIKSSVLH